MLCLQIYSECSNLCPVWIFMPMASKYRSFFSTLFYSFGLSLCVETFQLLTKVGSFDVDDLLLNTLGGSGRLYYICDRCENKETT